MANFARPRLIQNSLDPNATSNQILGARGRSANAATAGLSGNFANAGLVGALFGQNVEDVLLPEQAGGQPQQQQPQQAAPQPQQAVGGINSAQQQAIDEITQLEPEFGKAVNELVSSDDIEDDLELRQRSQERGARAAEIRELKSFNEKRLALIEDANKKAAEGDIEGAQRNLETSNLPESELDLKLEKAAVLARSIDQATAPAGQRLIELQAQTQGLGFTREQERAMFRLSPQKQAQFIEVIKSRQGAPREGFTLSEKQTRFDAEGNIIARGSAAADSELPEIIKQSNISDQGNIVTRNSDGTTTVTKVQEGSDIALSKLPAEQRAFEALLKGLTPEQKTEATMIRLGLSPRAVGSASQTIVDQNITEAIADSEATIKQRVKFAEKTGASRAKAIDSGVLAIRKIDKNLRNLDRAKEAIRGGAGVGAIESKFPSFRAASVALDQIQGELALDVVGATTFGALSKGELDLAKAVALPTNLNSDELIAHLEEKQAAQTKLRDYFNEQIQFLDQGGTVAGFLREKERGTESQNAGGKTAEPISVDF